MNKSILGLIFLALMASTPLAAYELKRNDWLLRGVTGASINVVREDSASRRTPGAGGMVGAEVEYVFDAGWSFTGAVRPVFAPDFVDLGFGLGAKYRWTTAAAPFIPYASLSLTPAVLIPVSASGSSHFNLGIRPSLGCDYFVMRDLALGLEAALEPSYLFGSGFRSLELTIDIVLGVTWRI